MKLTNESRSVFGSTDVWQKSGRWRSWDSSADVLPAASFHLSGRILGSGIWDG